MSTYDELHDKYYELLTSKSGTRYERLTATVFKILDDSDVVVHDLKLVGETDVKHQIDVCITKNGVEKRILIECKDFDVSGDKVGLDIVRNFWAVVDDTAPDEGIIVTCNGYTKDAKKYAKFKGIELVILRSVNEQDLQNRITSFNIDIVLVVESSPKVNITFEKQEYIEKINKDMKDANITSAIHNSQDVFIDTIDGRFQITEYLTNLKNKHRVFEKDGHVKLDIPVKDTTIEIFNFGKVPFPQLSMEYEISHVHLESVNYQAAQIAELILYKIGETGKIITDYDLKAHNIDNNTGEID